MSKKYVDRKITVWERFHLEDDANLEEIIKVIENDGVESICESGELVQAETLFDTGEEMSVSENDNCHTIEVYDGNKCIWDNKDKFNTIVG